MLDHSRLTWATAVGIVLTVNAPAQGQTLVITPASLNFNATADSAELPPAQTIQITSATGASVPFTYLGALRPFNGGVDDFVIVSPLTGTTPATVTVGLDPNGMAKWIPPGIAFSLEFAPGSPPVAPFAEVSFLLTVVQPPPPLPASLVNAATLQPGAVAADEIVSIRATCPVEGQLPTHSPLRFPTPSPFLDGSTVTCISPPGTKRRVFPFSSN
jgi:hypothetical protein